jgi:hypothetical protein
MRMCAESADKHAVLAERVSLESRYAAANLEHQTSYMLEDGNSISSIGFVQYLSLGPARSRLPRGIGHMALCMKDLVGRTWHLDATALRYQERCDTSVTPFLLSS